MKVVAAWCVVRCLLRSWSLRALGIAFTRARYPATEVHTNMPHFLSLHLTNRHGNAVRQHPGSPRESQSVNVSDTTLSSTPSSRCSASSFSQTPDTLCRLTLLSITVATLTLKLQSPPYAHQPLQKPIPTHNSRQFDVIAEQISRHDDWQRVQDGILRPRARAA